MKKKKRFNRVLIWIILAALAGIIGNTSDRITLNFFTKEETEETENIIVVYKDAETEDDWIKKSIAEIRDNYEYEKSKLKEKIESYLNDDDISELGDIGGAVNERNYFQEEIIDKYEVLNNQLFYITFQNKDQKILTNFREGLNQIKRDIIDLYSIYYGFGGTITLYEYVNANYDTEEYLEDVIGSLKPGSHFIEDDRANSIVRYREKLKSSLEDYFESSIPMDFDEKKGLGSPFSLDPQTDFEEIIERLDSSIEKMSSMMMLMDRKNYQRFQDKIEKFKYESWLLGDKN